MYPIASIWNTGHSVISGMHTLFIILNNIGSLVYGPHHQSLSVGYINAWTLANSPSHHLLCDTVSYTWHQTLLVFEDLSRMCHCVMDRWFLTFWRHTVSSISRVKWSHEDEGTVFLWNVRNHLPSVTVWKPRRPESSGCCMSAGTKLVNCNTTCSHTMEVHGSIVGWCTALEAGISRIWFLVEPLRSFTDLLLPATL
jgi:hypothetical protein